MAHLGSLPLRVEFVQTLCIADKLGFLKSIENIAKELHKQKQKSTKMPYISLPKLRNKLKKSPPLSQESAEQPWDAECLKDDSTIVVREVGHPLPLSERQDDPNSFPKEKDSDVESAPEMDSLSSTSDKSDLSQELTLNCTRSPQSSNGVAPAIDMGLSGTTAVLQPPSVEELSASDAGCGTGSANGGGDGTESELSASGGGCGTGSELDGGGGGRGTGSELSASGGGCGTGSELDGGGGGRGTGSELDGGGGGRGTGSELSASGGGCGTGSELDGGGGRRGTGSLSGGGCGTGSELDGGGDGRGTGSELSASGGGCGTGSELDGGGGGRGTGSELSASGGGCGTGSELDGGRGRHSTESELDAGGGGRGTGSELDAGGGGRGTGSELDASGGGHGNKRDKKHRGHPKAATHGGSKWFGRNKKQAACKTEKTKAPVILYYGMGAGRFCT